MCVYVCVYIYIYIYIEREREREREREIDKSMHNRKYAGLFSCLVAYSSNIQSARLFRVTC